MIRDRRPGAMLLAACLALAIGSVVLDRVGRVRAAGVMAPRFEVDPMWPKPLPNHWLLGNVIGVVGRCQRPYLDHAPRSLARRMETYAAAESAGVASAARPRRRCWSSTRPAISSGTGAARAKATTGRKPTTESPSTTRATSGSAATAAALPRPAAVGQPRAAGRHG